jgi:hypothetical protein
MILGEFRGAGNLQIQILRFIAVSALIFLTCLKAQAQESFAAYEKEFATAKQSILDGHVKDGIGQMAALLARIDPAKEPNNYWLLSVNLADYLHQTENYQDESTLLSQLIAKKLHNSNIYMSQQTALRAGRTLAFTGHADEGEKISASAWARSPTRARQRAGSRSKHQPDSCRSTAPTQQRTTHEHGQASSR